MAPSPLPDSIGPYRVRGRLGQGGMGVVYRAEDDRLGREVALKVLPEGVGDAKARDRLLAEARAAARLDHPHICTIYEAGEHDGRVVLAMARYEGETLRERLARGPLAPDEAAALGRQLAQGLAAAHARGITHRDLKPSNVFLCQGDRLLAKILDFGIAKVDGVDGTQTSSTYGTLLYAAPEQARGQADARSDLWSLGVVLYEALAGQRPFEGAYEAAILYAVLHEEAPPLPGTVPDDLAAIVMRLLAKDPEARFQSAEEVDAALAEATGERPASSSPVASRATGWKKWAVGVGVGALALAAGGLALRNSERGGTLFEPTEHHIAVLPFTAADSADAALADGLAHSLAAELSELDSDATPVWVVPISEIRSIGVTSASGARTTLGATAVVQGRLAREGDRLRLALDVIDAETVRQIGGETALMAPADSLSLLVPDAVATVSEALELDADPARLAAQSATSSEAYPLYLQGLGFLERPSSPATLSTARDLFERARDLDPRSPFVHAHLATAYIRTYSLEEDTLWLKQAEDSAREAVDLAGDDRPQATAIAWSVLTSVALATGRYGEAVEMARRAVVAAPRSEEARRALGRALHADGRVADAEVELREAINVRPGAWTAHTALGVFYHTTGEFEKAADAFREVIRLTPDNAQGYYNLGAALYGMGETQAAVAEFEKSAELQPSAIALGNLAGGLYELGRYESAAQTYRQALDLHPDDPYNWIGLAASLERGRGNETAARDAYRRATQTAQTLLAVNPNDADLLAQVALAYAELGQEADARQAIGRALRLGRDNVYVLLDAASVYAELNEREEARRWLLNAMEAGISDEEVEGDSVLSAILAEAPSVER